MSEILNRINLSKISDVNALYEQLIQSNSKPISKKELILSWEESQKIIDLSTSNDIQIISILDPLYPHLLKKITTPPLLLHLKGNIKLLSDNCVAVVGTRSPSDFSMAATEDLTKELVKEDLCIVSGLALGIDSQAHKTALDANGKTIAVLAHGLHTIYPAENKELSQKIVSNNGLLLSEYPFGFNLTKWSYVERDKLQSGLSDCTFVMECKVKSGTMHTAGFCLKQNRKLFVLQPPPNFTTQFAGNHELIRKSAIEYDPKINLKEIKEFITKSDLKS